LFRLTRYLAALFLLVTFSLIFHEHVTGLLFTREVTSKIIAEYGANKLLAFVFSFLAILVAPLYSTVYMIYIHKSCMPRNKKLSPISSI